MAGSLRQLDGQHMTKSLTSIDEEPKFYGVGYGRDGQTGVFRSQGEALSLTTGVSGALMRRFGTETKAQDYVNLVKKTGYAPGKKSGWYVWVNGEDGTSGMTPRLIEAEDNYKGFSSSTLQWFATEISAREALDSRVDDKVPRKSAPATP